VSARYDFTAQVWRSDGPGGWHFLTLPKDISTRIRSFIGGRLTFGSVRVTATIAQASWATSLFYDTKAGAFLLPLNSDARRKAKVSAGDSVEAAVEIVF
jgi:hypothetical protein